MTTGKVGTFWNQPGNGGHQLPTFFSAAEQQLLRLQPTPQTQKVIRHTTTQIVSALTPVAGISEKQLLIAQVTKEDIQAVFASGNRVNNQNETWESIWKRVSEKVLYYNPYKAKTPAERTYIMVRKISEMLRAYREEYKKWEPDYQSHKEVEDKAYKEILKNHVPVYLSRTTGFQSLLRKLTYHNKDIRLEEDMVLISAKSLAGKEPKSPQKEEAVPAAIVKKIKVYTPRIPYNFDEKADAAKHAAELMQGLGENDY